MKLNDIDFEILQFVSDNGGAALEQILNRFPNNKYGTLNRLLTLCPSLYEDYGHLTAVNVSDDSVVRGLQRFHYNEEYILGETGRVALSNRHRYLRERRLDMFLRVLPILISLAALIVSILALKYSLPAR